MDLSIFLSKCIGIYLFFISFAFVTQKTKFKNLIISMMNKPELMLVTGFMALIMGILLIVSHNIWVKDWRILITITGWMAFAKGASIILFPQLLIKTTLQWIKNDGMYYATFLFTFLISLILLYFGYATALTL